MKIQANIPLQVAADEAVARIKQEMESRSYKVANELRNASLEVLRGQRHGRIYTVPGTRRKYTASAPGEPPANRTGAFRLSWQPSAHVVFGSYISRIETNLRTDDGKYTLGDLLEEGTERMAARPYKDLILEKAEPEIERIYSEPYF